MNRTNIPAKTITAAAIVLTFFASLAGAQTAPTLKQVSVAKDGTTYGVLTDRRVVVVLDKEWKFVEGQLVQISVGSYDNVWGVNHYDELFRLTQAGWQVQPGRYKAVSAGFDGAVAALDGRGKVWRWSSQTRTFAPLPEDRTFRKIAVGRHDRIYALTLADEIYKFHQSTYAWRRVQGQAKDISVTFDGIVSIKDLQNIPFRRTDAAINLELNSNTISTKTNWVQVPIVDANVVTSTPISVTKSLVVPMTSPAVIIESASLTVESSPTSMTTTVIPADTAAENATLIAGECVGLKLDSFLNLPKQEPTQTGPTVITIPKSTGCIQQSSSTVRNLANDSKNQSINPLVAFSLTSIAAQAETNRPLAESSSTAACSADTTSFLKASAHSYVNFRLPEAEAGRTIFIPNGAYVNYVFPACHRVVWDAVTFSCRNGKWQLTKGNYSADGFCHGWAGPSPYLKVGNW